MLQGGGEGVCESTFKATGEHNHYLKVKFKRYTKLQEVLYQSLYHCYRIVWDYYINDNHNNV